MNVFFRSCLALRQFVAALVLVVVPAFFMNLAVATEPASAQFSAPETKEPPQAPNIVLIVADDLGYGELGCYGQEIIRTPNIDALASRGMKFTNFYSAQAVCAPARCGLMTGYHMGHASVRDNRPPPKKLQQEQYLPGAKFPGQTPLPTDDVTIAELLKQRGYATAAIGKWGLGQFGTSGDPNEQGFDLFYGFNCQVHAHNHYPRFLWRNREQEQFPGNDRKLRGDTYSQDKFTETALEFIDENAEQPFFLYLPFAIPHLAIQVPEKSLAEYQDTIKEQAYQHRGYLKHPAPRAGYAAMITHMDRDIGRIVERLEEHGLTDNTIIIFTSDNGPTYGRLGGADSDFFNSSAGLRGRKGSLWEGGIRVPLVVQWKGHIAAGTESELVSAWWDVLPTLCEAVSVDEKSIPDDIDGISFWPTLVGKPQTSLHDCLYWEFPAYGGQQAMRMGKWKLIRQNLMNPKKPSPCQLFDLETDPQETNDIAQKHPKIVEQIQQRMQQERTPSEIFPIPALDNRS